VQHGKNSLEADFYRMDRVYGKHVTWEKRMDIAALSAVRRLPGLPSSYSGLDTMLGRDDKLTFEDTLNGQSSAVAAATEEQCRFLAAFALIRFALRC